MYIYVLNQLSFTRQLICYICKHERGPESSNENDTVCEFLQFVIFSPRVCVCVCVCEREPNGNGKPGGGISRQDNLVGRPKS